MTTKKLIGQQNQCPSCGQFFARNSTFSAHRIGRFGKDRRCMTTDELVEAGFKLHADGFWRGLGPGRDSITAWMEP